MVLLSPTPKYNALQCSTVISSTADDNDNDEYGDDDKEDDGDNEDDGENGRDRQSGDAGS